MHDRLTFKHRPVLNSFPLELLYVTDVQSFQATALVLKFQTVKCYVTFRKARIIAIYIGGMKKEERNTFTLPNHGGAADSFT